MRTPITVTFDTNTYSTIANPQIRKLAEKLRSFTKDRWLSKKRRLAWWYIQWCIRRGRIRAGIPEAAFAAESLPNTQRVSLLLAVGTNQPRPTMTPGRLALISMALRVGFRVMHSPRIGYGALPAFSANDWAADDRFSMVDRQKRMSDFVRHFNQYPLEALKDFGEKLSKTHNLSINNLSATQAAALHNIPVDRFLWREGLQAEETSPRTYASSDAFLKDLRKMLADWADFDITATHYAYGYDWLCTEDKGKLSSNSVFGSQYATSVQGKFHVNPITALDLAAVCWRNFRFPLLKWH